jgi:DNA repair exonuclease SbcCD nuclease subunit
VPLVLGGDVFDRREQEPAILEFARREVGRLRHPCYVTDGNHDSWGPDDERSWAPHIGAIRLNSLTQPVDINGVSFIGLASTRNDLRNRLSEAVDARVLVLHQMVDVFCKNEAMFNLMAEWIPPVEVCLIGDYHVRMTAPINGARTVLHSPGSTVLASINESPVKKATLLQLDAQNKLSLVDVPLAYRPKLEYEAATPEAFEKVLADIPKDIAEVAPGATFSDFNYPVVRVDVLASIGGAYGRLLEAVGSPDFLWVFPRAVDERPAGVVDNRTVSHEQIVDDVVNELRMEEEIRPLVRKFAKELLTKEPELVVAEIKSTFGV